MTLESSKNLGGIGAILMVIGVLPIPYATILSLVGLILLLIGLKGLADFYKEGGIFNNALYAIILGIVGVVIAAGILVVMFVSTLLELGINISNIADWASIGTQLTTVFTDFSNFGLLFNLLGAIAISLIVLFVFAIIAVLFYRRSLTLLASKTGVGLFGTAGLLMLIGAVLTIIVIGALLIWIAWILVAVAFFRIRAQPTAPTQTATPPPPQ
jgi:uncharacterized membrane protein